MGLGEQGFCCMDTMMFGLLLIIVMFKAVLGMKPFESVIYCACREAVLVENECEIYISFCYYQWNLYAVFR